MAEFSAIRKKGNLMALTRKEIDARHRKKCKDNNICPSCGKKKDRDGYYCTNCTQKHNERQAADKKYCIEHHICTVCRKERVYGTDRTCFECREKSNTRKENYSEEQKERYKKMSEARNAEIRKLRKEKGICVACGKRKVKSGRVRCGICLDKDAERHRLKRIDDIKIREYRKENHLCYFCGNPIENKEKQVCTSCSETFADYSNRASRNQYWRGQNNLIFKKR